jgi:hypothetical protein
MASTSADSMDIPAATKDILEGEALPDTVYVLPLKKRVPVSKLDNIDVVKMPDTNRRRLIGTYSETNDAGETKVHNVSVYIKSAAPEGASDAAPVLGKRKARKPKSDKSSKKDDDSVESGLLAVIETLGKKVKQLEKKHRKLAKELEKTLSSEDL